jgi:hypothetical protein
MSSRISGVDVMMAILPSPRLLLHQVPLSLPRQTHLLRLHPHPRQSPQTLLSAKAITLRPRPRLPRLRLQLLPRPSRLLRLTPPKPVTVAAVVAVAVAATCTREGSTYLDVSFFFFLIYSLCLPRATFFTQNGVAGACGKVHQDSDLICAMGECSLERLAQ